MSSVWKAPHGSDAMPEMVVKIIGSKHFRYLVEKPKNRDHENLKAEPAKVLQKFVTDSAGTMNRDPPVPTNPTDPQIKHVSNDVKESKHPENNQKPENNQQLQTEVHSINRNRFLDGKIHGQASVHCSSVPSGDQSLSYIHGLPRRNFRDWSLEQMERNNSDQPKVNYGKVLWFLKVASLDEPQQSERVVDSNLRKIQSCNHQHQSTAPQDSDSQLDTKQSLLEILKMALRTTNGKLNIENLNLSFRKEDRSFSGCLPPPKSYMCGKHGLYLTLSLLETLLSHQELGYHDEIKWQRFIELLNRASSDLSSDTPTGKKSKEITATPVPAEVPEMSQSRTGHMETPEELLEPENPPAETSTPKEPLNASLKIRPVSQPFMTPVMKNEPEESEAWIDRFRKLENALYLCDLSHTGVLEKERAKRLIHNYNLIYNLSLSPRKIDQALRRFRAGENMLLEPALRYLKEL